jgi:hypothetical protein
MLREFQRGFGADLLGRNANAAASGDLQIDARGYVVHAHNARESLKLSVESTFPVTRRLVGVAFFAAMAEQFVKFQPPARGWLSAFGAGFPQFVAQYRPAANLHYLPDVARIEWARVHASSAANEPGLDLKALAGEAPGVLENLFLGMHGAATLVTSPYPVFDIWREHQHEGLEKQLTGSGSQDVLVSRTGKLETAVALLSPGDAALLKAVMEHLPFGIACESAISAEMDYDLGPRLGALVDMRVFSNKYSFRPRR